MTRQAAKVHSVHIQSAADSHCLTRCQLICYMCSPVHTLHTCASFAASGNGCRTSPTSNVSRSCALTTPLASNMLGTLMLQVRRALCRASQVRSVQCVFSCGCQQNSGCVTIVSCQQTGCSIQVWPHGHQKGAFVECGLRQHPMKGGMAVSRQQIWGQNL